MIICIDTFFIGRHRIERNILGLFACDLVWNSVTEIDATKWILRLHLHEMVRSL